MCDLYIPHLNTLSSALGSDGLPLLGAVMLPPMLRPSGLLLAILAALACQPVLAGSLDFLPSDFLSDADQAAFRAGVETVRTHAFFQVQYSRHGGAHRAADKPMGGVLVRPPDERRVPIVDGFRRHLNFAAGLPFPWDARLRTSALPEDLQAAVARAVELGPLLEQTRADAIAAIRAAASSLRPVSDRINTLMPRTVRLIAARANTAFMAALVDGLRWLDTTLVERFVFGFPVTGDIPDSGVYRPVEPLDTLAAFHARLRFFTASTHAWNTRLHHRLSRHARAAAGEALVGLHAAADKTRSERDKGLVRGPFDSPSAVRQHLASLTARPLGDIPLPRAMPRFPVRQKGSWRAIDDGKASGANAATRLHETVTTPSFVFPAIVARAVADAASARHHDTPGMTVALCDLAAAYRTVPTSQPEFTTFGLYDPHATPPRPQYYYIPGHPFGLTSAVVNFNRVPELVTIAARAMCLALLDHYFDDFIIVDLEAGGRTALSCVESIMLDLGSGSPRVPPQPIRSPELDPSKTQETAHTNTVLGVLANLSAVASSGIVRFHPTPERIQTIIDAFEAALQRGKLTPHEASRLRGKLYFLLSAAYGAVGRAATLPLIQRQYRDDDYSFVVGSELHSAYLFFRELLPRLPSLHMPVVRTRRPSLIVYTDAAFWLSRPRTSDQCTIEHGRPRGGLGAVVYDPEDGSVRVAHAEPDWRVLFSSWRTDQKTYIAELEALAALAVYTTYPSLFAGRTVQHYVDNTVALSAIVHGYARKPALAKAVNVFWMQAAGLRASIYLDWVPSKANIADLPSRFAFDELALELAGLRRRSHPSDHLAAPDVAAWDAPLGSWADRHAAHAGRFAA
jgi:hypothetical protein